MELSCACDRELPRSPAFSLSAAVIARPVDRAEVAFDVRGTNSYYSDVFNTARGKTDPHVVANAKGLLDSGPNPQAANP